MLGAPPPPPPGAPPPMMPPPPVFKQSKGGSDDRSALLGQIRGGAKLKKTVTNDRSAAILANKPSNSSVSQSASPGRSGGGAAVGPNNLGGLFANGMPTLKKRGTGGPGPNSSIGNSNRTPESPQPKSFDSIQNELKKKMANGNSNAHRGPPPPTPVRGYNNAVNDDSSSRQTFASRNGSSNGLHQVSSTTSLTSLNQVGSRQHRKTPSSVSASTIDSTDSTQNNNFPHKPVINHGKPHLAPKPPSTGQRKSLNGGPIQRSLSISSSPRSPENNNDFKSKLSNTLNHNNAQSMTSLSTKQRPFRPTDPPPSIPNTPPPPPKVKPPNHAPPPPPNVIQHTPNPIPQPPTHAPPPPPHRAPNVPSRGPPIIPQNSAPPPPPRYSSRQSSNAMSELENRFAFHDAKDFPRPMPFRGVKKVYTSRSVGSKQQAPLPPNQIQLTNRLWESSTC